MPQAEKLPRQAPKWTPALTAAVINTELDGKKPDESFTRDHVIALGRAGCTEAQVRDYLVSIFANQKIRRGGDMVSAVDHIMGDLRSYGFWE